MLEAWLSTRTCPVNGVFLPLCDAHVAFVLTLVEGQAWPLERFRRELPGGYH
jgi:hypothetical protein